MQLQPLLRREGVDHVKAIVSSLAAHLHEAQPSRIASPHQAFACLAPGAPLIQFTYSLFSPDPAPAAWRRGRGRRTRAAEPAARQRLGLSQAVASTSARRSKSTVAQRTAALAARRRRPCRVSCSASGRAAASRPRTRASASCPTASLDLVWQLDAGRPVALGFGTGTRPRDAKLTKGALYFGLRFRSGAAHRFLDEGDLSDLTDSARESGLAARP